MKGSLGGIPCPVCNGATRTKDSRPKDGTIRRRRVCVVCKVSFTTEETIIGFDLRRQRGDDRKPEDKRMADEAKMFASMIP